MRILTINKEKPAYGYIGTPGDITNMYDYRGELLRVGDIVGLINGDRGSSNYGLGIVVEQDPARGYGKHYMSDRAHQFFVMGLASSYNSIRFAEFPEKPDEEDDDGESEFWKMLYDFCDGWELTVVKPYNKLVNDEETVGVFVAEVEESEMEDCCFS